MGVSERERATWIVERLGVPATTLPAGLSPSDREALEREADAYRTLWRGLGESDAAIAAESAPQRLADRFQRRLVDAPEWPGISTWRPRPALAVAFGIATVIAGIAFAFWLERPRVARTISPREPAALSVILRLEAVLAQPLPREPGGLGTEGLEHVVRHEPSPSVRLAALDVLAERHERDGLERQLGLALASETDPLVRITMIRMIGELGLVADAPALRALAERKDLDPIERREVERVLAEVSS